LVAVQFLDTIAQISSNVFAVYTHIAMIIYVLDAKELAKILAPAGWAIALGGVFLVFFGNLARLISIRRKT